MNISGVIADVTVKQYYKSTSDQVLEAVYVFPASVHAAVYSMKMKIGSREIVAVIKEKEQARKDYEKAKSEGKRASLLVQDRPNLFQMNLANIAPGDLIEIEMKYTEMLVPDDKIYTFSFPTIAAPRYGGWIDYDDDTGDYAEDEDDSLGIDETETNFQEDPRLLTNSAFDIRFNLISPVPIDGIECITHEVNYGGETVNHSQITLKDSEKKVAPKDFVVKYKLAGDLINSGLLLSKGEGKNAENFFLLTIQPPKRIDPAYIPPREYIFVLDVSGSMDCFPSVVAKKTIYNLLDKLRSDDKFNLILFASGFDVFSKNLLTATRENIESAFKFMAESNQGGGTELLPALETALKMPKNSKASRSIVVITDGLIDFESKAFKVIRDNLNKANVFTFGIGTQMNKLTIEGMAKAGMGLSFAVDRIEDAEYQSERFVKYISTPILADIKVTYDGFGVSKVEPTSVPDLFPDRPIVIYGKWDGKLQGGIKIEAINGQEKIFVELPVTKFGEMVQGEALKQLWARKQIELLSDYQSFGEEDKYQKEITDLGLKYNLMTAYTSFIAVDNEVVPKTAKNDERIESNVAARAGNPVPAPDAEISPDMQDFSSVKEVDRASAEGGTAIDDGGMSESIDISANTSLTKTIESIPAFTGAFISYEEIPRIADFGALRKLVIYPVNAKRAGIEGKVIIAVYIDKYGKPRKTKILDSPSILLEQPVIDAAMKHTGYVPAIQNKQPVGSWLQIPITYRLNEKEPLDSAVDNYQFKKIEYNSSELENNIKYTQETLNKLLRGIFVVLVDVDRNGKITKIAKVDSCDNLLFAIAKQAIENTAFTPAALDGKPTESSINITFNMTLPETDFNFEFKGKTYTMKSSNGNNNFSRFAVIKEGRGENIRLLDRVELECSIFDPAQNQLGTETFTMINGIGEATELFEDVLKDMKSKEESIFLLDRDYRYKSTCTILPKLLEIPYSGDIFLKIKVLDINPK